jgi:cysteine-rich repeat protein
MTAPTSFVRPWLLLVVCVAASSLLGCVGEKTTSTQSDVLGDSVSADTTAPVDTSGGTDTADVVVDPCAGVSCDDSDPCNGQETCVNGGCAPGIELADATDCGAGLRCFRGVCGAPFCGDGIVDEDEACDDGNLGGGDGCESDCTPTCAQHADCDDGESCNGAESCDLLSGCVPGGNLADGTACDTGSECRGGSCVSADCGDGTVNPTQHEECDDGNLEDGDGCDADCTFTCVESADCSDGDVCNGEESCDANTHTCNPGEALGCTDNSDCTENICDPEAGCFFLLIDGDGDGQAPSSIGACGQDCDDGNPNTYFGAEELCDGFDNNCNGQTDEVAPTWYVDCDADGYAINATSSVVSCAAPTSAPAACPTTGKWITRAPGAPTTTDCNDANPDVFPGQTQYFTSPIAGSTSYDYDCDGTQTKQYTAISSGACTFYCGGRGWLTSVVPACGATPGTGDNYRSCLQKIVNQVLVCSETLSRQTQACR